MTVKGKHNPPTLLEDKQPDGASEKPGGPRIEAGIAYFKKRRFEDCSISRSEVLDFKHALLNRVSGKGATFTRVDFRFAELTDCYFHGAEFTECNFTGAKLRRCNFRAASFQDCCFDYITIEETPIDYRQVVKNLPDRPNVAQEVLHALRRNAVTQGEQKAIRELTLLEVDQEREHLRRALKGQGEYYRKKYGTIRKKLAIRLRALALWLSSFLWGHGEKISRLLFFCLISMLALSILSVMADTFSNPNVSVSSVLFNFWRHFLDNIMDLIGVDPGDTHGRPVWVVAIVAILRILFGGIFVALIFRAISRR